MESGPEKRNVKEFLGEPSPAEVVAVFSAGKKYGAGLYECDVDGDRVGSITADVWGPWSSSVVRF